MAAESSSRTFDPEEFDYSQFMYEEELNSSNSMNDGWKTVTYKKNKSKSNEGSSSTSSSAVVDGGSDDYSWDNVFEAIELEAEEPKKAKFTVSQAASQIDSTHLSRFLHYTNVAYREQQDLQLLRFVDYFGNSFAKVRSSQFPWMEILKESSVADMVYIPIAQISDDVIETSKNWIYQKSSKAIASFVMWSLDNLVSELKLYKGAAATSNNIMSTHTPSKVAIFLVLAMVLRYKPDVLISLLPLLKKNPKYQGKDKLNLLVWVITQATEGDMIVGMFMWVHFLLPMVSSIQSNDSPSIDLILQVVERIIDLPYSRFILKHNSVRKGERIVSPAALNVLMRLAFPAESSRLKESERFKAIYPPLREVALIITYAPWTMKQITEQILPFALKATVPGIPELAKEGADLFIWCLFRNPNCYHQWDDMYIENIEASVAIMKKLCDEWTFYSTKISNYDPLKIALMKFMLKNEKELASKNNDEQKMTLKDAQKPCKKLLSRVTRVNRCVKVSLVVAMAIGISATYMAFNNDLLSMFLLN